MKKVIILQRYLPHYRYAFFRGLAKANPDLDIKVFHSGPLSDNQDMAGDEDFSQVRFPIHTFKFLSFSLVFQKGLIRQVIKEDPDLLICEGTFGVVTNNITAVIRKLIRKKNLLWAAGWDNPKVKGISYTIKSLLIRIYLLFFDGAIVYGSMAKNYLRSHGFPQDKITIAQNTIDIERIRQNSSKITASSQQLKQDLGLTGKIVICYAGGLAPFKRVDVLLQAYALVHKQFPDLACLLIGDGPLLSKLQEFVRVNNLPNVIFAGEIISDVEAYIGLSDIFVLPGIGGLAINQAMALGKPVVATIADGTQEDLIIHGKTGYLAAVDDPQALGECISYLACHPEIARETGRIGQDHIYKVASLNGMISQYSKAIQGAISHG